MGRTDPLIPLSAKRPYHKAIVGSITRRHAGNYVGSLRALAAHYGTVSLTTLRPGPALAGLISMSMGPGQVPRVYCLFPLLIHHCLRSLNSLRQGALVTRDGDA
jgi:hypothetical protein